MTQVKSVRITKAARQDMLGAVMEEWEKQNPRPESTAWEGVLDLVAEQIKKHSAYAVTQRFRAAALTQRDLHFVYTQSDFYAQVVDSEDRIRTTIRVMFTKSQADARDLKGFLETTDYVKGRTVESDWKNPETVWVFSLVADRRTTVVIDGEDPKYKEVHKEEAAIKEWDRNRKQLRSETLDLLDNFNTTKQLREGWPEMVPYLPPHLANPDEVVNLPVPLVSRLNERLGISE